MLDIYQKTKPRQGSNFLKRDKALLSCLILDETTGNTFKGAL